MTQFAVQAEMQAQVIEEMGPLRSRLDGREFLLFGNVTSLDDELPEVDSAVVVVHGALRNAGHYFRIVEEAARGREPGPLILAPQFLTTADVRGRPEREGLLHWETEDWKSGFGEVSSFEILDALLDRLLNIDGLRKVTVAGNSAGGQFVNRYAAVGDAPDKAPARVRFVVANPSTYLYFDRLRPTPDGFAEAGAPEIDHWRYGFGGDRPRYVRENPDYYFQRYLSREVVYLLGEEDADPAAALLEIHPAALAQGRTRYERGVRYYDYLQQKAGGPLENHQLVRLPGIGHDAHDVFTSSAGVTHLFGH
ncbi:alpha/beta fold hydrolase [Actinomadura gamaensis]|uniref:Alpha/beta fold hydrolase n=1 Tax=Actinomadura gamaensis TaxID=1763541 RepID=A0ABV9TP32_9ACTN